MQQNLFIILSLRGFRVDILRKLSLFTIKWQVIVKSFKMAKIAIFDHMATLKPHKTKNYAQILSNFPKN